MIKQPDPLFRLQKTLKNIRLLFSPFEELYFGVLSNTIPWHICAGWMIGTTVVLVFKIDHLILSHTRFNNLYPYYPILYKIYAFCLTTLGFWCWAWNQVRIKREKLKTLTAAFKNAGLESKIGRLPNLVSDFALDPIIRKMRVTNAGFPVSKFQEQSKYLESELGIYIDVIKENRETRIIEMIYSHFPMPENILYTQEEAIRTLEFMVGRTRAYTLTENFRNTPHLLVAGQTGGGKSTFLRQLIVHVHLNDKTAKFLLIDLKGGLEFSLFESRKQFIVVPSVLAAIEELKSIDKILDERMALIKKEKCKDIDGYIKKMTDKKSVFLNRQFVVVDEAAEMFLAGHHANSKDIQVARGILSRIARQGRAVGVHLIVATQRPDSRSLDPQVKANLTGVLCFQMMNDASSIAVLGNGRATDLPKVPGRAIWKNGIEMLEVQTPFLTPEEAEKLLGPADNEKKAVKTSALKDVTNSIDNTSNNSDTLHLNNNNTLNSINKSGIETD
ncbi:MAG: FtsK/SpoIIIE domain-containing protein [Pseudobdellovibrio sp.]